MSTQSEVLQITLKIGTRQFPMKILRADEEFYRKAQELINERFSFYGNSYPGLDGETYLMMTLLDVAVRFTRMQSEVDPTDICAGIQSILDDIEKVLPQ